MTRSLFPPMRVEAVTDFVTSLPIELLKSKRRMRPIAEPRQIIMALARHATDRTLHEISREFERHHTTVLHAAAKVPGRMGIDYEQMVLAVATYDAQRMARLDGEWAL